MTTGSLLPGHDGKSAAVCQVHTAWKNEVLFTPDPTQGGKPIPGLAGRLYLFGPQIDFPLVGDGSVVIDLYDESRPGANEVPLEEWRIDKDTLKRLLRRDPIGQGYTLFLPWATYRPDITSVHLKLCYQPSNGTPLYAISGPLTLGNDSSPIIQTGVKPVAGK